MNKILIQKLLKKLHIILINIAEAEILKKSCKFKGSFDKTHIPKNVNIRVSKKTFDINKIKLCFRIVFVFRIKLRSFISIN